MIHDEEKRDQDFIDHIVAQGNLQQLLEEQRHVMQQLKQEHAATCERYARRFDSQNDLVEALREEVKFLRHLVDKQTSPPAYFQRSVPK